jgi:hypothetical protein
MVKLWMYGKPQSEWSRCLIGIRVRSGDVAFGVCVWTDVVGGVEILGDDAVLGARTRCSPPRQAGAPVTTSIAAR